LEQLEMPVLAQVKAVPDRFLALVADDLQPELQVFAARQ
jgi:hypothetical protein